MIFGEDGVDLPDELLEAQADGRLVLFVGAGISARAYQSQSPESFYPLFPALVEEVSGRLGRALSMDEQRDIESGYSDRVLGSLDTNAGEVGRIAAEILSEQFASKRTDCHRAVIRLANASGFPKIVTTNFDRLLERALEEEGLASSPEWRITVAPWLPPIRRFGGVCYLHGRVDAPDDFVLTDRQIGRAYMDEGWALRFAHAMFRERDVLFLGYSLDDPPLRYLSLALEGGAASRRWALVRDPGDESVRRSEQSSWERRNVTPIWFPSQNEDFRALERTIGEWTASIARTFLDRRNVLSFLGEADPIDLPPHQLAVARYYLRQGAALRDFARSGLHQGWLEKLLDWGLLADVLTSETKTSSAAGALIARVADWLAEDPVKVCGLLAKYRYTIDPSVLDELCRGDNVTRLPIEVFRQVLEFFRPAIERSPSVFGFRFVEQIVDRLTREGCIDDALWILGLVLRVQSSVLVQRSFEYEYARVEGRPTEGISSMYLRFDLRFADQLANHHLKKVVKKTLVPNVSIVGTRALHWLTSRLLDIRATENRGSPRNVGADFVRSAIETHEQDKYRDDPVNSLIVAIRDIWEALHDVQANDAREVCEYWRSIQDPIVERLRIHGLRKMVEAST